MGIELVQQLFQGYFEQFSHSALFQSMGVLFTFLYSITPSFIPIPTELFISVLVMAKPAAERFSFALLMILITTTGAIIADVLILYGGRHLHKLTRTRKKSEMRASHSFHRYGLPFFLATPSISLVIWGANEALLLYAGHYRANVVKTVAFFVAGEFIRGFVIGIIILKGMGII